MSSPSVPPTSGRTAGRHTGPVPGLVVLVVVLVALLLALLAACAGDVPPDAAAGSDETPSTTAPAGGPAPPAAAAEAQRVGSAVPEDPSSVVLPGGVPVPVRAVSTTQNGVLDVPSNIAAAGWWRGGSRIGDPFGSTLLAAHVDSETQGLGPFADLLSVSDGERILLRSASYDQTFRVQSLELLPQGSIDATSELHSPAGERRLTLVTCAGPYDAAKGGYQNLAVVVAVPAGPPRARAGR